MLDCIFYILPPRRHITRTLPILLYNNYTPNVTRVETTCQQFIIMLLPSSFISFSLSFYFIFFILPCCPFSSFYLYLLHPGHCTSSVCIFFLSYVSLICFFSFYFPPSYVSGLPQLCVVNLSITR